MIVEISEGSFLNGFLHLREKLAPRHKVGTYANVGFGSVCTWARSWRLGASCRLRLLASEMLSFTLI
jgi:hypothetical protein